MQKYLQEIAKFPLFQGIPIEELSPLLGCLKASVKKYSKNAVVFGAGAPALYTGILLSGEVQVVYEDVFGNRSILGGLRAGELFGEAFSCAGVESLPVSVVARSESEVLLTDCRKILTACSSECVFHHRLIRNLVQILAQKNLLLNQKIRYLSRRSTREKLLAYLSDRSKEAGSRTFSIPFNRQELADFLCVERSAMSSELGKLRDAGILRFRKQWFQLLEPV